MSTFAYTISVLLLPLAQRFVTDLNLVDHILEQHCKRTEAVEAAVHKPLALLNNRPSQTFP